MVSRDVQIRADPGDLRTLGADGGEAGDGVHQSGADAAVELSVAVQVLLPDDEPADQNAARLPLRNLTLKEEMELSDPRSESN